jgi:toxin ParE1/3/4
MPRARLRPRAHEDMFDLWAYIADDNPDAADRVAERLNRAFDLIALNPKSGRTRPDIGPEVRSFIVDKYVAFYRIVPGGLDIGRVVHGARNITPEDVWLGFESSDDRA